MILKKFRTGPWGSNFIFMSFYTVQVHSCDSLEDVDGFLETIKEIEKEARAMRVSTDKPVFLVYRMEKRGYEGEKEAIIRAARYMEEYMISLSSVLTGEEDAYDLFEYKDIVGSDLPHSLVEEESKGGRWTVTHLALVNPEIPRSERRTNIDSPIERAINEVPDYHSHHSIHGFFNGRFNSEKMDELMSNPEAFPKGARFWIDYLAKPELQREIFEQCQIPLISSYKIEKWEEYVGKINELLEAYDKELKKWKRQKYYREKRGEAPPPEPQEPDIDGLIATFSPPFNTCFENMEYERQMIVEWKKFSWYEARFLDVSIAGRTFMSIPCAVYALKQAGVEEHIINLLIKTGFGKGATIKTYLLNQYLNAEKYQLCIRSMKSNGKKTVNKYPKKIDETWKPCYVDAYDNHMFIHKVYNTEHAGEISLLTAISQGFECGVLEKFNAYDYYKLYSNYTLDPMVGLDVKYFFEKAQENDPEFFNRELAFIESPKTRANPDKIYYVDFEATTNEEHHIPYMVHCLGPDIDNTFIGGDCARQMLQAINAKRGKVEYETASGKKKKRPEQIRCYIHNLKYDFGFLQGNLKNVREISKGAQLYSAEGIFGSGNPPKYSLIEFWDTLPIMRCRLSKAIENYVGKERAKEFRKEACPYAFYTRTNFELYSSGWAPIEEFCKGFNNEDDKSRFLEIIKDMPEDIYDSEHQLVNYMKYSAFYCRQDVCVMKEAFENIRKLFLGGNIEGVNGAPPFKIDIFQFRTASSIAWAHFLSTLNTEGLHSCSGILRLIGRLAARGGRTMIANNESCYYKSPDPDDPEWDVVDYDAVSLYPTAGSRAWIAGGKPIVIKSKEEKWTQKEFLEWFDIPEAEEKTKKYADGWIHVTKMNARKPRKFPMICIKDPKTKLNNYKNYDNEEVDTIISMIDLYNFIDYQEGEFEWDAAIVWDQWRNFSCRQVFKDLNEFRKKNHNLLDKDGNKIPDHPIANLSKLVSNSIYGKTNQKPSNVETVIIDRYKYKPTAEKKPDGSPVFEKRHAWDEYFNANAYRIVDYEYMPGYREHIKVRQYRTDESSALVQLAVNILAFSKRSIGSVISIAEEVAEEMDVPGPFYTDTDSVHLIRKTLPEIERRFEEKYGYKLAGPELGQYHIDFDDLPNREKVRGAIESIFCAKKVYADRLVGVNGTPGFHMRMKGICSELVKWDDFVDFYNDLPVYKDLAEAKPIFRYDGGVAYSLHHMVRRVMSRACRDRMLEELRFKKRANKEITQEELDLIAALNKAIHEEEEGPEAPDPIILDAPPTPQISPDHCRIEPEPWVNKPWDPSCDGPTQPLPPDDVEIVDFQEDDQIDIETEDEDDERPLKIAKIDY